MDFKPQQTPPRRPEDTFGAQPNPDNEPETYVTPEGRPTTLGDSHVEPQVQPVAAVTPKKSGAKKWLVGGVFVLLLAGLGALAYWQWAEAQNARQELTSVQTQLEAAQADLAEASKTSEKPDAAGLPDKTDKELVADTVSAYWHAAKGAENDKLVTTVDKLELPFARTSVSTPTGAGVSCISKKSDDMWLVLYCTQGTNPDTEAMMTKYGIPESIVKT